jgi:hypothetical protein
MENSNTEDFFNPFPVMDYVSAEYFCDRKDETAKIISAFANGRNVTLISVRRLGKTALLKHVLKSISKTKSIRVLYIDILPSENLRDFIKIFSEAIINDEKKNRGFLEKISKLISGIKGKLVFDDNSGVPSVEVTIEDEKSGELSVQKIFEYLAEQKEKYIIAIDEFQQIVNYPEKNVEAILRTQIQHQHKDNFVFSGSSKHTLVSMFSDYGKPFYQSSDILELGRIDVDVYSKFIKKHFKKRNKEIELSVIKDQIANFNNHTFYVQYFFNRLFEKSGAIVNQKDIDIVSDEIIREREYVFYSYRNLLSSLHFSLLIAIAKEGGVAQINAGSFLNKYKLAQPSSVSSAVKIMIDREMIYYEDGKYRLYDVYFEKWLKKVF